LTAMSPVTMSKTPAVSPLDTKQLCYYSEATVVWYYGSSVSAVGVLLGEKVARFILHVQEQWSWEFLFVPLALMTKPAVCPQGPI